MNKSIFSINSLSKYSELFQIVGVIGLIASLIFVGIELRQSHKIALSAQQQNRAQMWVDVYNTSTNNDIAFSYPDNEYNQYQLAFHNTNHIFWEIIETDYLRYRLGLMDESIWESRLGIIKSFRTDVTDEYCDIRKRVWQSSRNNLDSELVKLVEEIPFEECKKL
jgi:hypothetical protein